MGFSDPLISDIKINTRGERFGDIHSINATTYAMFDGFALNIMYNSNADITEIFTIPFEYCRLQNPDSKGVILKILVNPFYGSLDWRKAFTKEYDVYNPDPKVVLAQQARDLKKYKGQILYIASTQPLSRFYPVPKYYSAENWMSIDEAIGGFHKNNIENNFLQSSIIKMIGDESTPSTHPDDVKWNDDGTAYEVDPKKTVGYRFNIEMQKFTGWNNAGNIMALWGASKEAMPDIQAFPSNTQSELFKTLQDITTEQIARATKVPSVLANISSGAHLGGDGNVIRASVKLMQQRVVKSQSMFERVYKDLLSRLVIPYNGTVKILHYNPFPEMEKIDPLIWAALPIESQRAWIKKNTEFEIIEVVPAQPAQPVTPVNKFSDVFYADYPGTAKAKAKKALDFKTKMASNCGGKQGWITCDDIIAGRPLSFKMIKRIYNYLNKNRQFENHIFSNSCEAILFSAWGGSEMLDWATNKIASINE